MYNNNNNNSKLWMQIYRVYYTVARRYEYYFRVANQYGSDLQYSNIRHWLQ